MKALSIKQPWAWAILHAGKDIENRSWNTHFRGEIAIHSCGTFHSDWRFPPGKQLPDDRELVTSAIVGVAELVDVVQCSKSAWFHGPFGFVLANVRRLDVPIACKGDLKLWELPARIAQEVRRQIPEARHYVAYNKSAEWGDFPEGASTVQYFSGHRRKRLEPIIGQTLWVVEGVRSHSRTTYYLCGEYRPERLESEGRGFRVISRGCGFSPKIDVSQQAWFHALWLEQNRFSFGLNRIRSGGIIDQLKRISASS